MVSKEVVALQGQLEDSASQHSLLQGQEEEHFKLLTQQLATRDAELAQVLEEKSRLTRACAEEREAREKLKLVIADLEFARDNLTHKLSTFETTIQSLKSQVSLTESSQQLREEEREELEESVASLSGQLVVLEGQLGAANDRLLQHERAKAVLELTGMERLEEIRSLTRELEEARLKVESVGEMQDRMEHLERELGRKQEEVSESAPPNLTPPNFSPTKFFILLPYSFACILRLAVLS